ncbi:MAG TPA: DNA repair protein RecO [Candidatus Kapabacteria bacterium]|jgi:DNA repair protein RecO (recombination protein O)
MLVKTDSIVLRGRKQGDTSKLATLYTREFGKIDVIAKGAREQKSKFGGALEMFARGYAVIYKKERADALHLLSDAGLHDPHLGILRSLERIETATTIVELILRSMHDEEANQPLFDLLSQTFEAISTWDDADARAVQFQFYLRFARLMGFELDLNADQRLSLRNLALLRSIEQSSAEIGAMSESDIKQLRHFFQNYFAHHLPGVGTRSKAAEVFAQL